MQIKIRHFFLAFHINKNDKTNQTLTPTASGDAHRLFLESNLVSGNIYLELDSLTLQFYF